MFKSSNNTSDIFPPSDWKTVLDKGGKLLVSVFPNPTEGDVSVVFTSVTTDDAHIVVRDLLGQIVLDRVLTAGASIYSLSLGSVENGTYIYQISMSGNAASGKVIKINK